MSGLVSIIIPVFNLEHFIERCINSVLEQTYRDIEIILVDDGSTDESPEICDQFSKNDKRITVLHQANAGVSAARNAGMDAAVGEYITFVDGDDTIPRDAIEQLVCSITTCNADMAIGTLCNVSITGAERIEQAEPVATPLFGLDFLNLALSDHPWCYYACRILYKRSFVSGLRFCAGRITGEDSFFVFQCALLEPCVTYVPRLVYRYHTNASSASRTPFTEKKYEDIVYFITRKQEIITADYPELIPLLNNLILKITMMLLQNMAQTRGKLWRTRERKALKTFFAYKSSYIPATNADMRWYGILSKGLYFPYKYMQPVIPALSKLKKNLLRK